MIQSLVSSSLVSLATQIIFYIQLHYVVLSCWSVCFWTRIEMVLFKVLYLVVHIVFAILFRNKIVERYLCWKWIEISCGKMKKYKLPLSPPQLPPGYLTSIPRRDVYRLMKEVRLDRIASICAHIELIPEGKHTSLLRPPIHIAGGHPSWLLTLHGIRHFYEVLTEKDQEAELAKARELPRRKRDLFTRNLSRGGGCSLPG